VVYGFDLWHSGGSSRPRPACQVFDGYVSNRLGRDIQILDITGKPLSIAAVRVNKYIDHTIIKVFNGVKSRKDSWLGIKKLDAYSFSEGRQK
jgi:hypothetical protein